MKVFAIGDLHLAGGSNKPMDVFGPHWDRHFERISESWCEQVADGDTVLIPGDISWAIRQEQAVEDLMAIGKLPGRKILLRGNHDYWWNSLSKLRAILPENMYALQNDCIVVENIAFTGSRGWTCPGSSGFAEEDEKLYQRELIRMGMSLEKAPKDLLKICMLHFPPFNERRQPSGFTELFEKHGVHTVVYGHLHGRSCKNAFEGERNGVNYLLCSADHLNFAPRLILETE